MQILRANSNFIHKIVITNTIPQTKSKDELKDMVHVIDVSGKFNVFENHYLHYYLLRICTQHFFSTSLGLIAEYIRRHHYHESVAVLQHFMPIRANDKEFEETSDSEDEEEEKENDSTNGSDLGTWLEPDLKKGTLPLLQLLRE